MSKSGDFIKLQPEWEEKELLTQDEAQAAARRAEDSRRSEREMRESQSKKKRAATAHEKADAFSPGDLLRLPAVERERLSRKHLFSFEFAFRAALWTLSAALIVCYFVVASWSYAQVEVPNVMGLQEEEARVLLVESGLEGSIAGVRNAVEPEGEVLQQEPIAGHGVQRNDRVELIVSAGPEGFEIPDLIGEDITSARTTFERLGLQVVVEQLQAEEPAGTVLLTAPPSGTRVFDPREDNFNEAGEYVITVFVATPIISAGLVEYQLNGLRVVIEPRFTTTASGDVSFDVARRLSSLFEAAHADVTITRNSRERHIDSEEYAERAARENPQLHIILSVREEGPTGIIVRAPVDEDGSSAQMVYERMKENSFDVRFVNVDLFGYAQNDRHSVEVVLGSTASVVDVENFGESFWRDHVARAIYMAVSPPFSIDIP